MPIKSVLCHVYSPTGKITFATEIKCPTARCTVPQWGGTDSDLYIFIHRYKLYTSGKCETIINIIYIYVYRYITDNDLHIVGTHDNHWNNNEVYFRKLKWHHNYPINL